MEVTLETDFLESPEKTLRINSAKAKPLNGEGQTMCIAVYDKTGQQLASTPSTILDASNTSSGVNNSSDSSNSSIKVQLFGKGRKNVTHAKEESINANDKPHFPPNALARPDAHFDDAVIGDIETSKKKKKRLFTRLMKHLTKKKAKVIDSEYGDEKWDIVVQCNDNSSISSDMTRHREFEMILEEDTDELVGDIPLPKSTKKKGRWISRLRNYARSFSLAKDRTLPLLKPAPAIPSDESIVEEISRETGSLKSSSSNAESDLFGEVKKKECDSFTEVTATYSPTIPTTDAPVETASPKDKSYENMIMPPVGDPFGYMNRSFESFFASTDMSGFDIAITSYYDPDEDISTLIWNGVENHFTGVLDKKLNGFMDCRCDVGLSSGLGEMKWNVSDVSMEENAPFTEKESVNSISSLTEKEPVNSIYSSNSLVKDDIFIFSDANDTIDKEEKEWEDFSPYFFQDFEKKCHDHLQHTSINADRVVGEGMHGMDLAFYDLLVDEDGFPTEKLQPERINLKCNGEEEETVLRRASF